jgi:hypothetical protein
MAAYGTSARAEHREHRARKRSGRDNWAAGLQGGANLLGALGNLNRRSRGRRQDQAYLDQVHRLYGADSEEALADIKRMSVGDVGTRNAASLAQQRFGQQSALRERSTDDTLFNIASAQSPAELDKARGAIDTAQRGTRGRLAHAANKRQSELHITKMQAFDQQGAALRIRTGTAQAENLEGEIKRQETLRNRLSAAVASGDADQYVLDHAEEMHKEGVGSDMVNAVQGAAKLRSRVDETASAEEQEQILQDALGQLILEDADPGDVQSTYIAANGDYEGMKKLQDAIEFRVAAQESGADEQEMGLLNEVLQGKRNPADLPFAAAQKWTELQSRVLSNSSQRDAAELREEKQGQMGLVGKTLRRLRSMEPDQRESFLDDISDKRHLHAEALKFVDRDNTRLRQVDDDVRQLRNDIQKTDSAIAKALSPSPKDFDIDPWDMEGDSVYAQETRARFEARAAEMAKVVPGMRAENAHRMSQVLKMRNPRVHPVDARRRDPHDGHQGRGRRGCRRGLRHQLPVALLGKRHPVHEQQRRSGAQQGPGPEVR